MVFTVADNNRSKEYSFLNQNSGYPYIPHLYNTLTPTYPLCTTHLPLHTPSVQHTYPYIPHVYNTPTLTYPICTTHLPLHTPSIDTVDLHAIHMISSASFDGVYFVNTIPYHHTSHPKHYNTHHTPHILHTPHTPHTLHTQE